MGQEGAKLTAGVVYNIFDAAYRNATLTRQIPYYFVIDEAQEIGGGMRLEFMLSEGAKFGGAHVRSCTVSIIAQNYRGF